MVRGARFPEAGKGLASLRRAPSPRRYYDLGQSSIVEWESAVEDPSDGASRRFSTLRDLELRLEHEPAIPPSLLIFHCSRCGSTLLARLLAIDPSNRVFIEPRALGQFFQQKRAQLESRDTQRELRMLLRSYGLEPRNGERRLIFKLNSLAVRSLAAIRAVLPETPFIYLLRDPSEVVASLCRATPSFLAAHNRAALAEMLDVDACIVETDTAEQWASRYVAWNLSAAYARAHDFDSAVDYRAFATRYLSVARQWSDRPLPDGDPEVIETFAFDSKRPSVRFSPVAATASPAATAIAAWAYLRWLDRAAQS